MSLQSFEQWRDQARGQLLGNVPPERAYWTADSFQGGLFDTPAAASNISMPAINIPKEFLSLAKNVACHRDPERWALLYQALWRITHGEKHLLQLSTDLLVHRLNMMMKQVRRDAHKAKAFVRFRLVQDATGDHYVAWHQPDHFILPLVAPFFSRRFAVMRWSVITPDQSAHWDGEHLSYGPGAPKSAMADEDNLEELWRTYYRSTFNPARIKLDMMRREMPVRYWHTMPETGIIDDMLKEAPDRVAKMIKHQEGFAGSAEEFIPPTHSLRTLAEACQSCKGCPLYKDTSCAVFGEGPKDAKIMLIGEQPGDQEDLAGKPFVGPAGHVINKAFDEAGIDRGIVYMTNAVKHFKHDRRGSQRLHRTPVAREITACHPWLRAEIKIVQPDLLVTLGVTAGRSLLGPGFSLKNYHDKLPDGPLGGKIVPTYHPAAMLRQPDHDARQKVYDDLVADLKKARRLLEKA